MKKFGFTLAEILVSVAIVGVMAALTLPTLRTNTTNAQIGPKLAKAVSTFEQANESLLSSMSSDSLSDANLTDDIPGYINNLRSFLKITNVAAPTFNTKDNIQFTIEIENANPLNGAVPYQQNLGTVTININPSAPNEVLGTNIFLFSFWNDGSLRPQGGTNWNGNANSQPGGVQHWNNQANCPANAVPTNPAFCAGHIFENNLRVLYE